MRRLPVWILCMSFALALAAPMNHAGAQTDVSFNLRIGDRYRGPDLGFYGEPNVVSVPGRAGVYYVQDSNNDVYRFNNYWYMNYNGDWYRASDYRGPFVFVGYRSVPREVYTVPSQYRTAWTDYRDTHYDWNRSDTYGNTTYGNTTYRDNTYRNNAARIGTRRGTLRIGTRYNFPMLRFTDQPTLIRVPRSRIYYVQDSDYDVYRTGNFWYLNYNGDWYRSSSYRGPWTFVGYRSVPREITMVPTQYRRHWSDARDRNYDYSSSSDNMYYGNTGNVTLTIGQRYNGPDLGFYSEPGLVSVPGKRGVYYVNDSNYDVYRYGNTWYLNYSGDWYRANSYRGPFTFVGYRGVPRSVYTVPSNYRRTWTDYRDVHYDWSQD